MVNVFTNRRFVRVAASALLAACLFIAAQAKAELNLAPAAKSSTSFVSGHEKLNAINDGYTPRNSRDREHHAYGNWPSSGTQWVQYDWPVSVSTNRIDVYWFFDGGGILLPVACRVKYWNGSDFVPVSNAKGLGLDLDKFNSTTFDEVTTTKLRLEFDSQGRYSTGVLEFKVLDSGKTPNLGPTVLAGVDRYVSMPGKTYLRGQANDDGKPNPKLATAWSKASGPGTVTFDDSGALRTSASFSKPGVYVIRLTANDGELKTSSDLKVTVDPKPNPVHLDRVEVARYRVTSPFLWPRLKAQIVNWIPYIVKKMEDPKLPEGGIWNFAEAGRKLSGATDARHIGPVFSNGWVYDALESMCLAQTVDPQGDKQVIESQAWMRKKTEEWVRKILSAQEPDGYLQTMFTIQNIKRWQNPQDHEGFLLGHVIEAALAHFELSGRKDRRLYDAAKKSAECWYKNIGPAPKQAWIEGHQELEQALIRLARVVEKVDGKGKGKHFVELSKFLIDSRKDGDEYAQTHLPTVEQYEAVGHAVRAVYFYNGIINLAMETGNPDYHSAAKSLWNSIINKKYYVTGGLGSGESSEGFGGDYSLGNHSYCESCAGCGNLFFQHSMHMAYPESKYADLSEDVLYNNILGSVDLEGRNYTYTNALDSSGKRYLWHVCPCCVGNIPRTMLMLPTWMYTTGKDRLYVNLFVGSSASVGSVAGTKAQVDQKTNYPWDGKVSITVNPEKAAKFKMMVRLPNRTTSELYSPSPLVHGINGLTVNGKAYAYKASSGYAEIDRTWKKGDRIEFTIPMKVQVVKADPRIKANVGRVALRYGAIVYNIESVDQDIEKTIDLKSPLKAVWRPDLLGGVMAIEGKFADGSKLLAIPNYARLNRGGRSIVWIKAE